MMVRVDRLYSNESKEATYQALLTEAQNFLNGLDPRGLSRAFQ